MKLLIFPDASCGNLEEVYYRKGPGFCFAFIRHFCGLFPCYYDNKLEVLWVHQPAYLPDRIIAQAAELKQILAKPNILTTADKAVKANGVRAGKGA